MSMEDIRNQMLRRGADATDAYVQGARAGIIESYDPAEYAVRVRLQPEDTLTGWMKIKSSWVGNQFGLQAGPSPGDVVDVHHQEGDIDSGFVTLGHFNDQTRPLPVPSGEFWLTHKSGTYFRLTNDGTIQAMGDLHVNGDIYDKHGSLDRLRGNFNAHKHTDSRGDVDVSMDHPDPE